MPYILRKIRKNKWPSKAIGNPNEIQADCLGDLYTKANMMSVWRIDDSKSNLEAVITALASNLDHLSHIDYVLLDENYVIALNIATEDVPGETPFLDANQYHLNLKDRNR